MAAKRVILTLCTLSLLQTSFAGFDRFWVKNNSTDLPESVDTWNDLSEAEQQALIRRYQALKELPVEQSIALQQRMDWFTQLPEAEKQQMRIVWQQMSSQERQELRNRMQKAAPAERTAIRQEYVSKYQ
jgi:hypothetical protein